MGGVFAIGEYLDKGSEVGSRPYLRLPSSVSRSREGSNVVAILEGPQKPALHLA